MQYLFDKGQISRIGFFTPFQAFQFLSDKPWLSLSQNHGSELSYDRESCRLIIFTESWNHGIIWLGMDLKYHLDPTTAPWAQTPSSRPSKPHPVLSAILNRDEKSTTFLGNQFQCLTPLKVKNLFLISNLKLCSFSFCYCEEESSGSSVYKESKAINNLDLQTFKVFQKINNC